MSGPDIGNFIRNGGGVSVIKTIGTVERVS